MEQVEGCYGSSNRYGVLNKWMSCHEGGGGGGDEAGMGERRAGSQFFVYHHPQHETSDRQTSSRKHLRYGSISALGSRLLFGFLQAWPQSTSIIPTADPYGTSAASKQRPASVILVMQAGRASLAASGTQTEKKRGRGGERLGQGCVCISS